MASNFYDRVLTIFLLETGDARGGAAKNAGRGTTGEKKTSERGGVIISLTIKVRVK